MACGIQQDPPPVGFRLDRRLDGTLGEQPCLGGIQVIHAQFDVGLLLLGGVRPGGTSVVGQAVEPQSGRALLAEQDEVVSGVGDGQSEASP